MPRKKKPAPEAPASEPKPLAEILEHSPIAGRLASHAAPDTQLEPEPGHVERLARTKPGMQPVPAGFQNIDSYPEAGMRVNRSLDRSVLAIQFAEDRRASRHGLNSEIDTLEIRGFR